MERLQEGNEGIREREKNGFKAAWNYSKTIWMKKNKKSSGTMTNSSPSKLSI